MLKTINCPGVWMLGLSLGLASAPCLSVGMVTLAEEDETGLASWEWRHADISLKLVQRLPDQTRAFFLGRGFTSVDAESIATACVLQTIFRNEGQLPMAFNLDDWRLTHQGQTLPLQTRERWERLWQRRGVSQAARIAFRWSLLPTRQAFAPGDYNWGMSSFGLPPGETFDLALKMTIGGETITGKIPAIVCAADRS